MQVDLSTLDETQKRHINQYKYILLAISVFNRHTYVIPSLSKKGDEVVRAHESIF